MSTAFKTTGSQHELVYTPPPRNVLAWSFGLGAGVVVVMFAAWRRLPESPGVILGLGGVLVLLAGSALVLLGRAAQIAEIRSVFDAEARRVVVSTRRKGQDAQQQTISFDMVEEMRVLRQSQSGYLIETFSLLQRDGSHVMLAQERKASSFGSVKIVPSLTDIADHIATANGLPRSNMLSPGLAQAGVAIGVSRK